VLAILDPVDLKADKTEPGYGNLLREHALEAGKFAPIPRDAMEKKMAEFKWDPSSPCHEFQCGFDAANLLLSEYVLFGTVTALDGIYAYTFNLVHIPTGQVVLSQAGDVARNPGSEGELPLQAKLIAFISGIDPAQLDLAKKSSRGLMAVVDLSPQTPESRVLSERVATHVHASRQYDLMSKKELQELMTAMEIQVGTLATSDSGMIGLGTRLNVAYLVHSKLSEDDEGMRLDLALFDIAGKRRIRDWPSHSQSGFTDILHVENRFFTTLTGPKDVAAVAGRKPARRHSHWKRELSLAGISAAAGMAVMAASLHKGANNAQDRAETAYSIESAQAWKAEAEHKDQRTILFGALAGLSLAVSAVVWTF
jgi:hypothetical protein